MNIHHYERKHLFAQHQIDACNERITTPMIRSDVLRVDSFDSPLFGRNHTTRIDPALSALLDEIMSNVTGLSSIQKERRT